MPYLRNRAISKVIFSSKLRAVAWFSLYSGLWPLRVSTTWNSLLIRMSNLCRANMSCSLSSNSSIVWCAESSDIDWVQSKLNKNGCVFLGSLDCSVVQVFVKLSFRGECVFELVYVYFHLRVLVVRDEYVSLESSDWGILRNSKSVEIFRSFNKHFWFHFLEVLKM